MLASLLLLAQQPAFREHPLADLSLHELALQMPAEAQLYDGSLSGSPQELAFFELSSRLRQGEHLSIEDWRFILVDRGWLHWRERWPQAEPFAVRMHRIPFFQVHFWLELVPRVKDWKSARWAPEPGCTNTREYYEWEDYQVLGRLTAPEMDIELDLFEWPHPRSPQADRTRLGTITIHVSAVKSREDCLPALKDKQLEAQIAERLRHAVQLGRNPAGEVGPGSPLVIDPGFHVPGVALGLAAFLREAGQPTVSTWCVAQGERYGFAWEAGGSRVADCVRVDEAETVIEQMLMRAGKPHPFEHLRISGQTLVLRGSAEHALRDWDATQYWAGEVEIKLADLVPR